MFTRVSVQAGVSEGRRWLMLCRSVLSLLRLRKLSGNRYLISSRQLGRAVGGRVEGGLVEI